MTDNQEGNIKVGEFLVKNGIVTAKEIQEAIREIGNLLKESYVENFQ